MAKRIFETGSLTFGTQAAATALTTSQFMAAKGGTATQVIDFLEFLISGMATASTVAAMTVAYSSTLGITPTALASPGFDGPMMVNATTLGANAVVTYFAAGTGPVMNAAATLPRLNLGLNLFGGIIRWNAAPTQQWTSVGSAVNAGETVLFNSSAGGGSNGLANAHIIYEPY
jgi:hypothetical protein